jgi:hypothetical protein
MESTAIIMMKTWVMDVGVAVVVDKTKGGVLIKVEVCKRKRRGKREKRYQIERKTPATALDGGELDVLSTSRCGNSNNRPRGTLESSIL